MRLRSIRSQILVSLACLCFALILCVSFAWEYIPGTYYVDENGRTHGTGSESHYYKNGRLLARESFVAGILAKCTYYRPDGTVAARSIYDKEEGGIGYRLREDGTIRTRTPYIWDSQAKEFLAHGEEVYFDADGAVLKVIEFVNGAKIPGGAEGD